MCALIKNHWVTTSLCKSDLSAFPTPLCSPSFPVSVSSDVSPLSPGIIPLWPFPTVLPSLISQRFSVSYFLLVFLEMFCLLLITSLCHSELFLTVKKNKKRKQLFFLARNKTMKMWSKCSVSVLNCSVSWKYVTYHYIIKAILSKMKYLDNILKRG